MQARRTVALAAGALVVGVLAACAGTSDPSAPADDDPPAADETTDAAVDETAAVSSPYDTPLADVCPENIVLQWNWWPQADHGWSYQLIGDAGTVDPETYSYRGPLGDTGVTLELRSGGPAAGGQLPLAQLYQDDEILLGITSTEDSVGNATEFPTVSIFADWQRTPLVFIWGEDDWDFSSLADVRDSGETVLLFDGVPYAEVLTGQGLLDPDQLDFSYDGSPGRFVVEDGRVLQQGILTSEVYRYEHDIAEWGRPVHYLKVGDEYDAYHSQVSVRADRLEENRACFEKLVPLFQQASVDYYTDPGPTNAVLLDVVSQLVGSGWELSEGINEWAATVAVEEGIVGNGPDGVYGSFDLARLDAFIDDVTPALRGLGLEVPDDLAAEDIVTNEFLDPEVSL